MWGQKWTEGRQRETVAGNREVDRDQERGVENRYRKGGGQGIVRKDIPSLTPIHLCESN